MAEELRPVIINAADLSMQIGDQILLKDVTFTIHQGERVGLVGRNGTGKSTLMKILAGTELANDGTVSRRKELRSGYLPQEVELEPNLNVLQNIRNGAGDILELIHKYETIPHDSQEFHTIEDKINALDGWTLEQRIKEISSGLNTPPEDANIKLLSGGEKRRVGLTRVIAPMPDLLLLDEPTNHLDADSIEWLENFLCRFQGACLIVTHDRYFLDRVTTRILELSHGDLFSHEGNYTAYLEGKATREAEEEKADLKRRRFIRREVDWIRRGPKARGTKSQSRIDRFYDAVNQSGPNRDEDAEVVIPYPSKLGNRILDINNISKGFDKKNLIKDFSLKFEACQCIGIVGHNGLGKTTLLKMIMGTEQPDSGDIQCGELIQFNYIDQHRTLLDDSKNVFDEVNDGKEFINLGTHKITTWSYLKRFLFEDERIRTSVSRLSGGERNRLLLAKTLKNGGNFLILDEPTNDLDLSTLRVLEEALINFPGCVLVVSHDRYFLNRVCTGIIAFEGNCSVVYQEGDYDYYLQKRKERLEAERPAPEKIPTTRTSTDNTPKIRKLKWKEQKELEGMEETILATEAQKEELEAMFSKPDFFETHGDRVQQLTTKLEDLRNEITRLYARWEELEAIQNGEILEQC